MAKLSDQDFRDRPNNIDESGQRKWIKAKQPQGKWYRRRNIVGYSLLGFLIHGLIDFGWRLPANSLYAVTLVALISYAIQDHPSPMEE